MKKDLILYHANCLDGFGAAYAAWRRFGDGADYVPVSHGEDPPDVTGRAVAILDFSYPRATLEAMRGQASALVVIDHHKTAQADLAGLDYAKFDMDKSGAVLAWEYFNGGLPVPPLLQHIQDRDLWRFDLPGTKAVCEALRGLHPTTFEEWHKYRVLTEPLIEEGRILLTAFDREIGALLNRKHTALLHAPSGEARIGLAVNAPSRYASELGNRLARLSGTFGLVYSFDGLHEEWACSIRSIGDYDVSEIAKRYGGGGHLNSAGFSVDCLEVL